MQPGRVLLPEVVDDYDPENPERRGHNVVNIKLALERFAPWITDASRVHCVRRVHRLLDLRCVDSQRRQA